MADIEPTSIDSEELFESPTITLVVEPTSIGSEELFESPSIALAVLPTSIASGEAFGSPTVAAVVSPTSIPSAEAFGSPSLGLMIYPTSIASAEAFGTATIKLPYVGDGTIYIGSIGNNTPRVILDFPISYGWSVNAIISASIDITWDVGELPDYWFRVLGDCQPNVCPTAPVNFPQKCDSYYMTMVLANSPKQVCEKLARSNFVWRIAEMGRFSTPANNAIAEQQNLDGLIDITCNKLEPVPFCQYGQCLPFCLDGNVISPMGAEMYVYDSFFTYRGTGGISVSGAAGVPVKPNDIVGSGGITISGSAGVTSSQFSFVGSGGINVSGEGNSTSTQWYAQGSGGITISGSVNNVSSQFTVAGTGGMSMAGSAVAVLRLSFISPGFSNIGPSFAGIQISGVAGELSEYYFVTEGSGGINMGGSGYTSSSNYTASGSGGMSMSGSAVSASPSYFVEGSGGVIIGGAGGVSIVTYVVGEGGILMDGSGVPVMRLVYRGQGGINISGSAGLNRFAGSGGISIGGSADVNSSWKGLYVDDWGFDAVSENLEPVFGVQDAPVFTPAVNTILTCNATLPMTLQVSHNLNDSAKLGSFLKRNGYVMPDIYDLTYRRLSETWRGNYHYRGRADETTNERWDIFVDWGCVSDAFGLSNVPVWKVSFYILRQNDQTGQDFDTRIVVYLDPEPLASRFTNDGIDLDIQINTMNKAVTVVSQNATVQSSVFFDNAGVFSNTVWKKQPFQFRLKAIGEFGKIPRYDIFPAFPKPGEYEVT